MNGKELLEKMDLIDPEFVEAAQAGGKKRSAGAGRLIPAAACAALLLAGAAVGLRPVKTPAVPAQSAVQTEPSNPALTLPQTTTPIEVLEPDVLKTKYHLEAYYNETGLASDVKRAAIPGYFVEELSRQELDALCPPETPEWMEYSGSCGFDGEGKMVDVFLEIATAIPDTAVALHISRMDFCEQYAAAEQNVTSKCGGVEYTLFAHTGFNNRLYLIADAYALDHHWRFRVDVPGELGEEAKAAFEEILCTFAWYMDSQTAFPQFTREEIPAYFDQALTHGEALEDPDFGKWFPAALPDGYVPESIVRHKDYQSDDLYGLWSRGYEDVYWRISRITDADRERITHVSQRENYDLALYPIPRAESVPEELREVVNDPVFLIEELTVEAVKARAYRIADAGDSDGWRMAFSVLYGDILVEIRTQGLEPEWVYEALKSLDAQ